MCFYVVIKVRNILSPGGFGKRQPFSFFWDLSYRRFWPILLNFEKMHFLKELYLSEDIRSVLLNFRQELLYFSF